ncbi:MAG TPA: ABC transporter ATP-binding protein [Spongiibacteraceae bacterium]|nr:ABC transporter ATP-binding protein [Spongiibacteraceae bacterium]
MSSDEVVIRVENLSKCYQVYEQPHDRLKQSVYPSLQRFVGRPTKQYFREFWALKNVSFEIRKGETVGIIGRNGSGKSTLLQLICGTLNPSSGGISSHGRIAALLELGSGFNPEFTGRENVYMNAAVLGLSREETDSRFDEITAFADIGDFIEQPVKTYSSGMMVRLAFAVAVHVDPQILIVDEALSVGDELFQRKCFARIETIKHNGATILFVSHSASTIIELCDRALLLDRGRLLQNDSPRAVVKQYHRLIFSKNTDEQNRVTGSENSLSQIPAATTGATSAPLPETDFSEYIEGLTAVSPLRYASCGGKIIHHSLCNENGNSVNLVTSGFTGAVRLSVEFDRAFQDVVFGFHLKSVSGLEVAGLSYPSPRDTLVFADPGDVIDIIWGVNMMLTPGIYFLTFGVRSVSDGGFIDRIVDAAAIKIIANPNSSAFGIFDISKGSNTIARRRVDD